MIQSPEIHTKRSKPLKNGHASIYKVGNKHELIKPKNITSKEIFRPLDKIKCFGRNLCLTNKNSSTQNQSLSQRRWHRITNYVLFQMKALHLSMLNKIL